eukprot:14698_1
MSAQLSGKKVDNKLNSLKIKYKKLYEFHFHSLHNDSLLINLLKQSSQKKSKNETFHVELLQSFHKKEAVELLACSFSSLSNDLKQSVFEESATMKHLCDGFDVMIDNAIEFGQGMVILNKYNKVCSVDIAQDMCDHKPHDATSKMWEVYEHVEQQMYNNMPNNHSLLTKMYKRQYENEMEIENAYGQYRWGTMTAVHPGFQRFSLTMINGYIQQTIAAKLGYKYAMYRTSNPIFIKGWERRRKQDPKAVICLADYKYNNHIFKDGTCMEELLNEVQRKNNYSELFVQQFKSMCRITVWMVPLVTFNSNKSK